MIFHTVKSRAAIIVALGIISATFLLSSCGKGDKEPKIVGCNSIQYQGYTFEHSVKCEPGVASFNVMATENGHTASFFITCSGGCIASAIASPESASPPVARKVAPPWFVADPATCQLTETSAQSRGDPHSFDEQGKSTGLLPQGQVTCVLEIQACGDMIVKHQVVNTSAGESCPEYLHFSYAPNTKVCCASWNEAKVSKSPCDPLEDMDCDGIGNDLDEYPLDWLKP